MFDFGTVDQTFFLAMEWVDGMDLMRLVRSVHNQGGHIPIQMSAYIVQQLAKGLDYAHRKTDDFRVPTRFDGTGFRLEPLGPEHNERDYLAWSHSIKHIHYLRYGIDQARRGWARKGDILNTRPVGAFLAALKGGTRRRGGARRR